MPCWWSRMPTTMNAAALASPWASSSDTTGHRPTRAMPSPNTAIMKPELADRAHRQQQLEIGLAQRPQPAATIV